MVSLINLLGSDRSTLNFCSHRNNLLSQRNILDAALSGIVVTAAEGNTSVGTSTDSIGKLIYEVIEHDSDQHVLPRELRMKSELVPLLRESILEAVERANTFTINTLN